MSGTGPGRTSVVLISVVVIAAMAAALAPARADAAEAGSVVISEIYYHPGCAVDYTPCPDAPTEFVELYNRSGSRVDLTGWRIGTGVDFVGGAEHSIAGGGRFVIAADPAGFEAEFGAAPDAAFAGGLANGGERLALFDPGSMLIDAVTYDDGSGAPGSWSPSADGDGHSLQLIDADTAAAAGPDAPGAARWWAADMPTPGSANSGTTTPTVSDMSWTVLPAADEPTRVEARVFGATAVTLDYRVGFPGTTSSVPMTASASGFSVTIPASAYDAGDLLRFRLRAAGSVIAPHPEDSIGWVGTTVADPEATSHLPVLEWFTDPGDYELAAANGKHDDVYYSAVLAYEGVVVDNVSFRKRGTYATGDSWAKRNWKFKLPDHHSIAIAGIDYPVDTIDLQGGYSDDSRIREALGHTVASHMGVVAAQAQHVRLQLNGEYFGLHTMQEHPDGRFLAERDMANATLYKRVEGDYEAGPQTPVANVDADWEEWDIPAYINMLAAASIIQNNDFAHANFYWWYDRDQTERFRGMIWDLDLSQGFWWFPHSNMALELRHPTEPGRVWTRWERQAPLFALALEEPLRELYLRRVRTLADEWFATGRYESMARELFAEIDAEWQTDIDTWGVWHDPGFTKGEAITRLADTWIDGFYAHLDGGGPDGDIPASQISTPDLRIEVDLAVDDPRREHLLITNGEETAIDISGWRLSGTSTAQLPPGSVLPAGGSAALVGDDSRAGFRAVTVDRYVLGTYKGALQAGGGQVGLVDPAGTTHARVEWGAGAPRAGLVLNEWNAVSSAQTLSNGDSRLGSVLGNGGDWFELVTVVDHLDIRGWTLEITDGGAVDATLTFSDEEVWSDLRSGTIITVAESAPTAENGTVYDEDVGYRPAAGDWWLNVVAGRSGTGRYISAQDFRVSNDDWQIAVYDASGARRFGPAGEGVGALDGGGVGKDEIGELEVDPTALTDASADYGDGDESTFGEANRFDGRLQDLAAIRPMAEPFGDVDCSEATSVRDPMFIAQHVVGDRVDSGGCPISMGQFVAANADVNTDGAVDDDDVIAVLGCLVDQTC